MTLESQATDARLQEQQLAQLRAAGEQLETSLAFARKNLDDLNVRAPVGGIVFDSRVKALNAVVRPAEPMMYVVPGDQPLQISARIDPIHVDQLHPGQAVGLRFTSYDQRQIPEITGTVLHVSADTITDQPSGEVVYEATLLPNPKSLAAQPELNIRPGMPVEAFIRTEDRTPIAYLVKPLTDYFTKAFRE